MDLAMFTHQFVIDSFGSIRNPALWRSEVLETQQQEAIPLYKIRSGRFIGGRIGDDFFTKDGVRAVFHKYLTRISLLF